MHYGSCLPETRRCAYKLSGELLAETIIAAHDGGWLGPMSIEPKG